MEMADASKPPTAEKIAVTVRFAGCRLLPRYLVGFDALVDQKLVSEVTEPGSSSGKRLLGISAMLDPTDNQGVFSAEIPVKRLAVERVIGNTPSLMSSTALTHVRPKSELCPPPLPPNLHFDSAFWDDVGRLPEFCPLEDLTADPSCLELCDVLSLVDSIGYLASIGAGCEDPLVCSPFKALRSEEAGSGAVGSAGSGAVGSAGLIPNASTPRPPQTPPTGSFYKRLVAALILQPTSTTSTSDVHSFQPERDVSSANTSAIARAADVDQSPLVPPSIHGSMTTGSGPILGLQQLPELMSTGEPQPVEFRRSVISCLRSAGLLQRFELPFTSRHHRRCLNPSLLTAELRSDLGPPVSCSDQLDSVPIPVAPIPAVPLVPTPVSVHDALRCEDPYKCTESCWLAYERWMAEQALDSDELGKHIRSMQVQLRNEELALNMKLCRTRQLWNQQVQTRSMEPDPTEKILMRWKKSGKKTRKAKR